MFEPYIEKIENQKVEGFAEKRFIENPMEILSPEGTATGEVYIFRSEGQQILVSKKGSVQKMVWSELALKNSIIIEKETSTDLYNFIFGDQNILILKKDSTDNYLIFCNQKHFTEIGFNTVARYIQVHAISDGGFIPDTEIDTKLTVHSQKGGHRFLSDSKNKAASKLLVKEKRARKWLDAVNSTLMALFAYLLFFALYIFVTKLAVQFLGFNALFDSFEFKLIVPKGHPFWDVLAKTVTYMSGPALSIIFAALLSWPYAIMRRKKGLHKLFFLWLHLYGFTFFFGAYISGLLTHSWFGSLPALLRMSASVSYGLLLVAAFAMLWFGLQANLGFVQASWSRMFTSTRKHQRRYKFRVVWLPYFATVLVAWIIYTLGNDIYFFLLNLSLFPTLLVTFRNVKANDVRFVQETEAQKLSMFHLVLLLTLIALLVLWSVL